MNHLSDTYTTKDQLELKKQFEDKKKKKKFNDFRNSFLQFKS